MKLLFKFNIYLLRLWCGSLMLVQEPFRSARTSTPATHKGHLWCFISTQRDAPKAWFMLQKRSCLVVPRIQIADYCPLLFHLYYGYFLLLWVLLVHDSKSILFQQDKCPWYPQMSLSAPDLAGFWNKGSMAPRWGWQSGLPGIVVCLRRYHLTAVFMCSKFSRRVFETNVFWTGCVPFSQPAYN